MATGQLEIVVRGQGLHEFTHDVERWLTGQSYGGDGLNF